MIQSRGFFRVAFFVKNTKSVSWESNDVHLKFYCEWTKDQRKNFIDNDVLGKFL